MPNTQPTPQEIAHQFERSAYNGYLSYGYSMAEGYWGPISKAAFVHEMRQQIPLAGDYFWYLTDFKPSPETISEYNRAMFTIYPLHHLPS